MSNLAFSIEKTIELNRDFICLISRKTNYLKNIRKSVGISRVDYLDILDCLIANIVEAVMLGKTLAISIHGTFVPAVATRIRNLLTWLHKEGFLISLTLGFTYPNGSSQKTELVPSMKIFEMLENNAKVKRPKKDRRRGVAFIRDDSGVEHRINNHPDKDVLEEIPELFNERVNVPIGQFYRVYNKDMDHGGRVYSSFQNLKKENRRDIKIDGEKTVEIDFQANHLNMLRFLETKRLDMIDPYDGFSVPRDEAKVAIQVILNSKDPVRALSDQRPGKDFRWNYVKAKNFLKSVIEKFPEIKEFVGSGIGLKLQKLEGEIALKILRWSISIKEVVLPIHDSFIAKESLAPMLKEKMLEFWEEIITFRHSLV